MEIVAYRMANGDEILGRFESDKNPDPSGPIVVLSKIRHVIVRQTAEGLSVILMPWVFSDVDADCRINKDHIMAQFAPSAETISSYQQQTTGIALVN